MGARADQIRGVVFMTVSVSYSKGLYAQDINNGTSQFVFLQDENVKRAWVYLPSSNICVNTTYNTQAFSKAKFCTGPGTEFSTFIEQVTFGNEFKTQAWADTSGIYNTVNPSKCVSLPFMSRRAPAYPLALPAACPSPKQPFLLTTPR